MKKIITILLLPFFAIAHPGIGIVKDMKGNIYYTDLEHVWKRLANGKKEIAVRGVHTHDLFMDANDNLFGQHSWYYGEAQDKWGHYVWRLNANGKLDTIITPREGFYIENFSFAQDSHGSSFWIKNGKEEQLMKTFSDGRSIVLSSGNFKDVQWMRIFNNTLYYVQYGDIFKFANGVVTPFVKNISGTGTHNSIFGIWNDASNNLYVANTHKRNIQKIDSSGLVRDFYTSKDDWLITGGLFDKQNKLWVIESLKYETRIREIDPEKKKNLKINSKNKFSIATIALSALGLLAALWIIPKLFWRRR